MTGPPVSLRTERKVITALFADLVGSTALAERFDPEDVHEIIAPAIARMVGRVEEFGGVVKDIAGDGMLALFGAHEAHEDDPERAVRVALRIVEDIATYANGVARDWNVTNFGVRVGIETGLVVLGPGGAGSRVEYAATGDAVNTAARLQSHADPFTVLVGPASHRLIEPVFEWTEPRRLDLKGKSLPIVAHVVMGIRPQRGKQRGLVGIESPLLGRDAEFRTVQEAERAVTCGRGGILFLIGEPGIGKSRLLEELRGLVAARGQVQWLEGRCVSYSQATPYWPFRDLLRSWLGVTILDPQDRVGDELRRRMSDLFAGHDKTVYPHLAVMLGVPLEPAADHEVAALSPEARQFRTAGAIRTVVRRLAAQRPVTLVIEDLHWADGASMQVLERLFPLTEREPVLVVVTHRSEPDHPSWPVHRRALQDHAHRVQVLTLKELPTRVERELLEALVGKGTLPADIERRVLTAADGNPFYLEELIRSLIDASVLVRQERGWRFKHGQPVGIPPTVERVIISRIDRLSPGARSAIQTASVLGRQFGLDLLEAVAGGNAALSVALSELVFLELLCEEAERVYRFKHAVIQEAAYNNMLKRQRRELHERAAEAIVLLFSDHIEQHYGILAHHYRAGERLGEALRYFELAANVAQRVHAVDATLENFSSAWEIAEVLDSERKAALRLQVGKVRSQAGYIGDARQDFEAVLRMARESGDRTLEIEAMNELGFLLAGAVDYQEALPLLEQAQGAAADIGLREAEVSAASRLSVVYTNLMRLDLAISRAHRADEAARDIGDERLRGMALDALQVASVMVGDMATVGEVSEDLVRIHQHRGDLWYLQLALFQWAWVDMAAGRWERAEQRFSEGLAVNRSIDDRGNVSIFPAALCWLARVKGDYGRAIGLGRQALELATAVGHTEFISWAAGVLGWTLLEVFAVREALECLEQALDTAHKAGARLELIRAACHLAFARWLAGDHSRAVQDSAIAERWIGEVTAPTGRVYLQGADGPIALANLHILRRDPARALELAGPVFDAALAADWHEIVAGAALVLGRAHGQMGETERAARALQIAVERAERFAMPGLAWRAHAELAALLRATAPRAAQDHASRSRDTITALSAAIEDDTIRAAFLAGAKAQLPKGETG